MNRKIIVGVIIILALAILLVPARLQYKDGGSVEYRAIAYSVTKYHRFSMLGRVDYLEGWKIEIFGITLRDDLAWLNN